MMLRGRSVVLATLIASVLPSFVSYDASFAASARTSSFDAGYVCYPGQFLGFKRQPAMRLQDRLARVFRQVEVGFPDTVCAPATSGAPPNASKGYLVCYPTRPVELRIPRRLTSQDLGTLTMPARSRRDVVCVESERVDLKERVSRAHSRLFVCYRTARTNIGNRSLRLRDTFRRTESVTSVMRYRGCGAARDASSAFIAPLYLLCSTISSGEAPGSVVLRNRFGYLKVVPGSRATVCVEARG